MRTRANGHHRKRGRAHVRVGDRDGQRVGRIGLQLAGQPEHQPDHVLDLDLVGAAAADLGLNPIVDGQTLRIPVPPLTEERRKDLVKLAGKYAEQQKIAVRNVRRDANDDLKKAEKAGEISQDEQKKMEAEVQKETDEAVKRIDEA